MEIRSHAHEQRLVVKRQSSFARIALATLMLVVLVDVPKIRAELLFFWPSPISAASGSMPVPQYNPRSPRIDDAFRLAARALPASATCVIDRDAWNDDYVRASYIMMPRRIWPYTTLSTLVPPTSTNLSRALRIHNASCLLVGAQTAVPPRMLRRTSGVYSLYVARPAGRP